MKTNNILFGGFALLAVLFTSCKDNSAFLISGTLEHPGDVKKVYLLETDTTATSGIKINMLDSVNLSEDGKFQFKHTSPYPNLYRLRVGSTIYDLIAQNGNEITFITDVNDKTHTYTITGSEESEKIKDFNKLSNQFSEKSAKIVAEYQAKAQALGHESDSLMAIYRPQFMQVQGEYSNEVIKFMNGNKTSLAGFYAATSLETYKYEQQLVAFADAIKDSELKNNPAAAQFIKQMMLVKPTSVGHKAPDFTTTGLDGRQVKLSDYKGKYLMLDFWASWCGPCRAENPNVVKQYALYKDKGLNILSISLDEQKADWQKAIDADKLTWNHASDLMKFDGPTERLYHIEAIPSNFIIDPQGNIVAKNITGADLEEFFKKTFSKP
jgi:peroxiredoxin